MWVRQGDEAWPLKCWLLYTALDHEKEMPFGVVRFTGDA